MATLGIALGDAGFQAALCNQSDAQCLSVGDTNGVVDWPGFAYFDGQSYAFGRSAEDQWFVHPRRVVHTFWSRLAHEPSTVGPIGKPISFSELSYHFFRQFLQRIDATQRGDKIVLAVVVVLARITWLIPWSFWNAVATIEKGLDRDEVEREMGRTLDNDELKNLGLG